MMRTWDWFLLLFSNLFISVGFMRRCSWFGL